MAVTPRQFMAMLSPETLLQISGACLANPQLNLWVLQLVAAQVVDITDPDTRMGIEAMVAAGLLTRDQADALVAKLTADVPPVLTVTSFSYLPGPAGEDGRFYVTSLFTLSDLSTQTSVTLCEVGTDVDDLVARQAAQLNAVLGSRRG